MAAQKAGRELPPGRLRRWLEGAWTLVGSVRGNVGRSGCAVGVLSVAVSVLAVAGFVDSYRFRGWTATALYELPLAALAPLVPLLIRRRHPNLARLVLTVILASAALLLIAWLGLLRHWYAAW